MTRKRFGGVGFALGCGCKDPKAVAVAAAATVAASSPRSGTEASTATTATSRRARTQPSGSASTGTLTVPSVSSSFLWEDADADGDEVEFKRASSATTPSFSGLLRELSELERSVKSSCARKSPERNYFSPPPPTPPTPPPPPPPPPLPSRPVQRRAARGDDRPSTKEGHGDFSPPPPPLPSRPVPRRAARIDDTSSTKEGHGDFSPPRPRPPSLQVETQQHRRVRSVDKVNRHEGDPHFTALPPRPLPPPPPLEPLHQSAKTEEDGAKRKEDSKRPSTPPKQHRKAKSCDATATNNVSVNRLDGSVAVVKQSEDPLSDFRRSMLNMIVENGIVAGDELRELLRRFLALNAPRHHDAILRAFAEIWDEVFAASATADSQHREPARQAAPRQRTPPRRRQPPPAWRV